MNWFLMALKKYATFSGRSQRSEYWYFALFYLIAYVLLVVIDALIGTFSVDYSIGLFSGIYSFAMLVPSFAVSVRRLHDTGRSAWWLLITLVPLLGGIILLVFMALDGEANANRYGENPKRSGSGNLRPAMS